LTGDERINLFGKFNKLDEKQLELNTNVTEESKHKIMDRRDIPKFYLDLNMYQRSCDSTLGVPYNLASMSLLLEIFSKVSNMIPGVATWIGGDTHIYVPHIETAKEQLKRTPYKLPTIKILKDIKSLDDILDLTIDDFELSNYQSHKKISYELFTGLKK
jgi:thymidylate synthase